MKSQENLKGPSTFLQKPSSMYISLLEIYEVDLLHYFIFQGCLQIIQKIKITKTSKKLSPNVLLIVAIGFISCSTYNAPQMDF